MNNLIIILKNILSGIISNLQDTFSSPHGLIAWEWALCFVVVTSTVYFLKNNQKDKSFSNLFKFIFPKSLYFSRSSTVDTLMYITNVCFYAAFAVLLFRWDDLSIYSEWVKKFLPEFLTAHIGHMHIVRSNGLAIDIFYTLCIYFTYETAVYFNHVAFHKIPFLWEIHKVHHTAEVLTPITGIGRNHPLQDLAGAIILGGSAGTTIALFHFVFQTPPSEVTIAGIAFFDIVRKAIFNLSHWHIPINIGPLKYFYMAPSTHLVHHSQKPEHMNKNFGLGLSWWDMWLGTYYEPKEGETFDFGCKDIVDWNSLPLWRHYWDPVVNSYKALRKKPIASLPKAQVSLEEYEEVA